MTRARWARMMTLFGMALCLLSIGEARPDVCPAGFYAWSPPTTDTTASGPASAPANDTTFNSLGKAYAYLAQGTKLIAVRNAAEPGGAAGTIKWTWTAPATIQNFPSPVPLSPPADPNLQEWIFLTGSDGFLYKLNADSGTVGASSDTRRCTTVPCLLDVAGHAINPVCAEDQIVATPAVQLNAFSNSAFQLEALNSGHASDDLVYVITRNACGDTTHNRVIAYWASDLSVKWIFNDNSTNTGTSRYKVDFGSDGCSIDYTTNTLYCGTFL